jgi:hypothetical protein
VAGFSKKRQQKKKTVFRITLIPGGWDSRIRLAKKSYPAEEPDPRAYFPWLMRDFDDYEGEA